MGSTTELACMVEGQFTELAEAASYLELTNRVCFYNYPNANGVTLSYGSSKEAQKRTLKKAQTLKLMPLQAKYKLTLNGEPTLGGHEVKVIGGKVQYGTQSIGVHEDVWIEEEEVMCEDGEKRLLPCLYAKARVWKRYEKCVDAIRRLFENGQLKTSWEINCTRYEFKDNIKYLLDYEFIGNTLLDGETNPPAYSNAGILDIASQESMGEMMVAEALACDLKKLKEEEVEMMVKDEELLETQAEEKKPEEEAPEEEAPEEETLEENPEEEKDEKKKKEDAVSEGAQAQEREKEPGEGENSSTEVAMLTARDLNCKLAKALEEYEKKYRYAYVCFVFPNEKLAWIKCEDTLGELDFEEIAYEVNGDQVTITDAKAVTLTASPREINDALAEREARIQGMQGEIAELKKVKALYDEIIAQQEKAKHDKEAEELRCYAERSGYFTEAELKGEEMSKLFSEVNTTAVKAMIADRVMAEKEMAEKKEVPVETATAAPSVLKMDLNYGTDSKNRSDQWSKFMGY